MYQQQNQSRADSRQNCHDSHNPPMLTNPCSMFSPFLYYDHVLSHLHFAIMTTLLTVSPTLDPLLTHSLLLSIFS